MYKHKNKYFPLIMPKALTSFAVKFICNPTTQQILLIVVKNVAYRELLQFFLILSILTIQVYIDHLIKNRK